MKNNLQEKRNHRVLKVFIQGREHKFMQGLSLEVRIRLVEGRKHWWLGRDATVCLCVSFLTQWEADLITHSQELTEGHLVVSRREA